MGITKNGLFGPANGKIGNLVSYNLKGQQVVRTVGRTTAKPSENQLASRARMTAVMDLFRNIKPYIKAGFIHAAAGTTSSYYNQATSYQLLHAVKFSEGIASIDYAAVKLSIGDAKLPENSNVERVANGLKFSWTYQEPEEWESRKDQVMTIAYFPDDQEAIYSLSGSQRSLGSEVLEIHPDYANKTMETYMTFVSEDRSRVSNSIYLGPVIPSLTS